MAVHLTKSLSDFTEMADTVTAVASSTSDIAPLSYIEKSDTQRQYPRRFNSGNQQFRRQQQQPQQHSFHPRGSKICGFHIQFGSQSKSCTNWCDWPHKKSLVMKSATNSRQSSRESSPIRQSNGKPRGA